MDALRELLPADDAAGAWLAHLDQEGAPDSDVALPAADDLPEVLLELAVPHEDIDVMVALRPDPERDPQVWRLLAHAAHALVGHLGQIAGPPGFPALAARMGPLRDYFYAYVLVAALPHVLAYHRRQGVPDVISRRTLADLGRNMAVTRQRSGSGGLDPSLASWLTLHFRGALYQLGRLQFQRARLGNRTGNGIAAAGQPFGPGDPVLGVHIPEFYGPLTPSACDASFTQARTFFARHFPAERYQVAACHSWLLDDQLAEYLSPESRILAFQRRFRSAYQPADDDEVTLRFVFGQSAPDLADLPRRTTLERAVVDHLTAGRHWRGGAGWLLL